jgi:hypothetical protein
MGRPRLAALAAFTAVTGAVIAYLTARAAPHPAPAPVERVPAAVAPPTEARVVPPPPSTAPVPAPSTALVDSKPESERVYMRELARLAQTDKPRALSFAKEGDEWYANSGDTAEARKAMVVTLLVDLGDMEEARELTRRFIAAFPRSPYRPIVQGVTGIHPRPHGPSGIEE